jgi:hypothetical protein
VARPEKDIRRNAPYAVFAEQLREERRRGGSPPYKTMARRAKVSIASLSQAANGEKLPSLKITLAYVDACPDNRGRDYWIQQWRLAKKISHHRDVPSELAVAPAPDLAQGHCGFVQGLREFKIWAGNPSLTRLSECSDLSRSTLGDATGPKRDVVPPWRVVAAFLEACCQEAAQNFGREVVTSDVVEVWHCAWLQLSSIGQSVMGSNRLPPKPGFLRPQTTTQTQHTPLPQRPEFGLRPPSAQAGIRSLDRELSLEVVAWVRELQALWAATGMSINQFAATHPIDKGTISRYLNGARVPRDHWFLDRLLATVADKGKEVTQAVREHLTRLQLEALEVAHPAEHRVRMVTDDLRLAITGQHEAERYARALEGKLAAHIRQIEDLADQQSRIRDVWNADRAALQAERDRLAQEIFALTSQLQQR